MTIEQELRLSYYHQVAEINGEHSVFLVQDVRNKKFYVKKLLTVYNADIYRYLLTHPIANTPRIFLLEEDRGVLTVIEEYIPGDTLEERLEQRGVLSEAEAIGIAAQLCRILAAFHSCAPAIVNRDIKPSNIKLTPDGVVKLLDMNAAKWSNDQSEKDTVLLGTQGYAAPEQYGFGPSSILTDIYSVGVLINVMLTGEFPSRQMPGGRLGKVVRKCVELMPANRYQSAAELLAALNELSGKAAAEAEAKTTWRRFLPPGFRKKSVARWLFSALGYGFVLMLGSGLSVENAGQLELILNRIAFTGTIISIIFFNGNYLDVQKSFILTRNKYRIVRWFGMAIVDCALLVLWVIALDLLVTWFVH